MSTPQLNAFHSSFNPHNNPMRQLQLSLFDIESHQYVKAVLFIYLLLRWVFVAVCRLSLVTASGGFSLRWFSSWEHGL